MLDLFLHHRGIKALELEEGLVQQNGRFDHSGQNDRELEDVIIYVAMIG